MASENQCQSSGTISVSAFQLVAATRYRSVEYEVRLCHTDTLKSRLGLVRRGIVSANLQFIGAFEVTGTTGVSAVCTYLRENNLLPDRQSAYRAHHSTETAALRVLSDILLALDSGDIAVQRYSTCQLHLTVSTMARYFNDCKLLTVLAVPSWPGLRRI